MRKDLQAFQQFGIGKKDNSLASNRRTVIWTRVSTIGQEDNTSLKNQRDTCMRIAEKDKLEVVEEFGNKGESAKAGALRKEFQRMLKYVKRKSNNIRFILFYDHTRFSREGGKAIFVKEELRDKYGVITKSAVLPLDTEDPYADLVDSQQLLFARAENEKRRRRTMDGLRAKLESGKWVGNAPFGYFWDKTDGQIKVHPEKGPIVKYAFTLRFENPSISVAKIREKIKARGYDLSKKHAHRILHNPFYCGMLVHNLLEGRVLKGNHKPIVSREVFLAVNNVFKEKSGATGVYQEEKDHLPLKVFMKCCSCGKSLTGYENKTKNGKPRKNPITYYKCNRCQVNKSATKLNTTFQEELRKYLIKPELIPLISQELKATFYEQSKDKLKDTEQLKKRLTELEKKKKRLRERFILDEEISRDEYSEFAIALDQKIEAIQDELAKIQKRGSNLIEKVDRILQIGPKLDVMWENGGYRQRQNLQYLVFPDGMVFDKKTDRVLTPRVNSIFAFSRQYTLITTPINDENPDNFSSGFPWGTPTGNRTPTQPPETDPPNETDP